jgi:RNA polymerase sigma-70 factor, ECF subfamily
MEDRDRCRECGEKRPADAPGGLCSACLLRAGLAAGRRGGGRRRVALDAVVGCFEGQGLDVVAVHKALDRLAEQDGRQAQVMTLRYFGGMTLAEVAAALGGSVVTVENDWRLARAWLAGQLGGWDG